jgi:tetratricopeptide (TPR) repeat protein
MGETESYRDFDGFIMPDGEMVPIQDTERMFSIIVKGRESRDQITEFLWGLAKECWNSSYFKAAYDYLGKILSLVDDPSEKAACLLNMGKAMEQLSNYQAALDAYSRAFELPQEQNENWYFLHNNLGYCLNQVGQCQEAEKHCRAAIEILPDRHNAYKNLGIALQGQGLYAEAAENLIHATRLFPADPRALAHLGDLIAGHREILEQIPDLLTQLCECDEAVQQATKGKSLFNGHRLQ